MRVPKHISDGLLSDLRGALEKAGVDVTRKFSNTLIARRGDYTTEVKVTVPAERESPFGKICAVVAVRSTNSLSPIIQEADLCLSYGAEGTVALTVLQGIPQLLVPRLVESYMTARRVVEAGAGLLVERSNRRSNLATSLDQILSESSYVKAARHLTSAAAELRGDAAAGLAMKHLSVVLGDVGGRVTYGSPA
jgi:UDP:flavonoid glycosyltransferase YjiC (YdhE family)